MEDNKYQLALDYLIENIEIDIVMVSFAYRIVQKNYKN